MFPYLRIGVAAVATSVALVLAFALPARADVCPPGTVQVGQEIEETPTEIIIHPVCKRITADPALTQKVCTAKRKIAADQEAIRQMSFLAERESFERFEQVATAQRTELKGKLLSAFVDQGLQAGRMTADKVLSLKLDNVHKEVVKLKDLGLHDQRFVDALYKMAQDTDLRRRVKSYRSFIDDIAAAKKVYGAGSGMVNDPDHAPLRFFLGALRIAQSNPELGLLVTTVDVVENLAYLAYLPGQIDGLSTLTDEKMGALNQMVGRMKQDMSAFKAARKKWQEAGGSGEPKCGP